IQTAPGHRSHSANTSNASITQCDRAFVATTAVEAPLQWCDQAKIRYSPQEVSYDVHPGVGLHIGTTSRTLQETKQVVSIRP
ncbi:MAG: hypothetical protein ABGW98_20145, partial [Myxococcales bacterium]